MDNMKIEFTECSDCGQGFLFPQSEMLCSDCENALQEKIEAEQIEMARADLFDETTNDLPPFFPWGKKDNRGFKAHRMKNPLESI
jgi:threonine synthase